MEVREVCFSFSNGDSKRLGERSVNAVSEAPAGSDVLQSPLHCRAECKIQCNQSVSEEVQCTVLNC